MRSGIRMRLQSTKTALQEHEAEILGKYYVQTILFDCLRCHQPVRLTEGHPQRMECGCMSLDAVGFHLFWGVMTLDDFSRKIESNEQMWAGDALELHGTSTPQLEPDPKSWGGRCKTFFEPYIKVHREWLDAHPEEWQRRYCDCSDEQDEEQPAATSSSPSPTGPTAQLSLHF